MLIHNLNMNLATKKKKNYWQKQFSKLSFERQNFLLNQYIYAHPYIKVEKKEKP